MAALLSLDQTSLVVAVTMPFTVAISVPMAIAIARTFVSATVPLTVAMAIVAFAMVAVVLMILVQPIRVSRGPLPDLDDRRRLHHDLRTSKT